MSAQVDTTARTDTLTLDELHHADDRMVMFLEPDQLVIDAARPVPRAILGRRTSIALWALRVFVIVLSAMVIYTFVSQLAH